jgi:hypothetical protein
MATILSEAGEVTVEATDGLWLSANDTARATGWTLKPEGMCQAALCVALPAGTVRDGRVDVAAFWQLLGRPVVHDKTNHVWVLGAGVDERNDALAGLVAPDFALPDLTGNTHMLSELRGKKVFLSTWASW